MDLNVNLDFSSSQDTDHIAEIIQAAITSALDANGIEPPDVTVSAPKPARVLITVKGGIADVDAVDGHVQVSIADFDNDEDVSEFTSTEFPGDTLSFKDAIAKAKARLGIDHDDNPAPRHGR